MTHRPVHLRGFTLIELIVVLMLISITLAIAAPSMRGWGRGQKLKDAATEFLAATGNARARAVAEAKPFAVEIKTADNTYSVKSVEPGGERKPVPGDFGQDTALPQDFTIKLTTGGATAGPDSSVAAGEAILLFFPDARCTPATVEIASPTGDVMQLASQSPAEPFRKVETTK